MPEKRRYKMEEKIRGILEKDEELLWVGSPEKFDTMDKTYGGKIKSGAVIKLIVGIAVIVLYILAVWKNGAEIMPVLLAILAFCTVYAVVNPWLTANKLRKKIGYAVTDRRLITVTSDVKGVPYEKIGEVAVKTDEDGHSTLLCGSDAVKLKMSKWRGESIVTPRMNTDTGDCETMVLYAVPEIEKVTELLRQYLPL